MTQDGGFILGDGLKQDGCAAPQEKGAWLSLAELEVLQPPPGIKQ